MGMNTGTATVESSMELPQKIKNGTDFKNGNDPAIPLLGVFPKKPETLIRKDESNLIYIVVLFIIAKIWKLPSAHQ